ncbi:MAG: TRAP transporter small permease [Desulfarculus sp.]|jgi:TRAP-type C4-dicarboxylate transport system permease small subunit|nr:MAG: TRAP transporter small permease [Desulfarculus sp.]
MKTINNLMLKVTYLLIIGIVVVIMWEVIGRSFLHAPTSWYLEVASLLGACSATLAAAYVLQEEAHLGVDFIIDRLPAKWRDAMLSITSIFGLIITLVIVIMLTKEIGWSLKQHRVTDNAILPISPFQIASTLGLVLLAVQFGIRARKHFVLWRKTSPQSN